VVSSLLWRLPSRRRGTNSGTSDTSQSGVRVSCRKGVVFEDLDIIALGMNGAALTALGEIVGSFFGCAATGVAAGAFGDRWAGVKLGESTLRDFFP
jgi:hypothetical protein